MDLQEVSILQWLESLHLQFCGWVEQKKASANWGGSCKGDSAEVYFDLGEDLECIMEDMTSLADLDSSSISATVPIIKRAIP